MKNWKEYFFIPTRIVLALLDCRSAGELDFGRRRWLKNDGRGGSDTRDTCGTDLHENGYRWAKVTRSAWRGHRCGVSPVRYRWKNDAKIGAVSQRATDWRRDAPTLTDRRTDERACDDDRATADYRAPGKLSISNSPASAAATVATRLRWLNCGCYTGRGGDLQIINRKPVNLPARLTCTSKLHIYSSYFIRIFIIKKTRKKDLFLMP